MSRVFYGGLPVDISNRGIVSLFIPPVSSVWLPCSAKKAAKQNHDAFWAQGGSFGQRRGFPEHWGSDVYANHALRLTWVSLNRLSLNGVVGECKRPVSKIQDTTRQGIWRTRTLDKLSMGKHEATIAQLLDHNNSVRNVDAVETKWNVGKIHRSQHASWSSILAHPSKCKAFAFLWKYTRMTSLSPGSRRDMTLKAS